MRDSVELKYLSQLLDGFVDHDFSPNAVNTDTDFDEDVSNKDVLLPTKRSPLFDAIFPDGSRVETNDDVWKLRKNLYLDRRSGISFNRISKRYNLPVSIVKKEIDFVEKKLEEYQNDVLTLDSEKAKLKTLIRFERLYYEGLQLLEETKLNKTITGFRSRNEALRFLRSVVKDHTDFLFNLGILRKSDGFDDDFELDGIPIDKMPLEALMEKAKDKMQEIFVRWSKDEAAVKVLSQLNILNE